MSHREAARVELPSDFEYALHRVPDELLAPLRSSWDRLPVDPYLAAGYRFRRLTRFRVEADRIVARPHRPVIQSKEHNHLWGDVPRTFAPIEQAVIEHPAFQALCDLYLERLPVEREGLFLRAHQIRVVYDDDVHGRPDPEGPHREGRLLVSILPVTLHGVVSGPTRLYHDGDPEPIFETVLQPGDHLYMNDARVLHTTEPFREVTAQPAWRDICLLTVTESEADGTIL